MSNTKQSTVFDSNDVDDFVNAFSYCEEKNTGVRIKINGKFMVIRGKRAWAHKSYAIASLKNSMKYSVSSRLSVKYKVTQPHQRPDNNFINEYIAFLESRGVLEFVEAK
jgi:hypothetical protein